MDKTEEELYEELMKMLVVGNKVRIDYGNNSFRNKLCHIRAIIDGDWVVYKYWLRHKKRWEYAVHWTYWFQIRLESGYLTLVK